jgi:predicted O-linked N-acetylglucosamine transferase (SPINDLY family)
MSTLIDTAIAHHQAGRLADAESIYRRLLEDNPANADALHLLGVVALQRGNASESVDLISQALGFNAENAFALNHLGEAYRALKFPEDAIVCFERAIKLKPDLFQAYNNMGNTHQSQGDAGLAIVCYRKALEINPGYAEAYVNLGNIYQQMGGWGDAIKSYEQALAIRPDFAEAAFNLGNVLKMIKRQDDAIPHYRKAIAMKPDFALGYLALARALQEVGERDEALACFRRASALNPEDPEARWGLVMTELGLVQDNRNAVEDYRAAFARGLNDLDAWFKADRTRDGFAAIGTQQPFYLAYHEQNNRDLIARFGALCGRLGKDWQDRQKIAFAKPRGGARVRVGIVSAHLCDHSVWNAITKGWFAHIDPRRFELHAFSLGQTRDQHTAFAKAHSARFVDGPTTSHQWADAIVAEPLDIVIYPEIGMDPMTAKLACLRLAPVQATAWGHPETSGLPTMDYYLSAAAFEPPDAQNNYTEKLIPLANLGVCYDALEVANDDLDIGALGIDRSRPTIVCPGTPFKYTAAHDRVFVDVAKRLGRCQFLLFKHPRGKLSAQLMGRLRTAFSRAGMNVEEYFVEVPWLSRAHFYSLLRQADLYMDTIGFSGFNSAMQAVECGLPVVTREGKFMRGRFGSGILRALAMPELIAESDDAYIDLIVQFASDRQLQRMTNDRIRNSRNALFGDATAVRAFERFLARVGDATI